MPMARITTHAHQKLLDLASRRGQSHQQVIDEALDLLAKRQFFAEAHEAYAALNADPVAAEALELERRVLDGSNTDGLESE